MTVQVSTRSWQHIDTIYGLWHCVYLVYAGLATLISYTYVRLIDSVLYFKIIIDFEVIF